MTECIHGMEQGNCDLCVPRQRSGGNPEGWAGKSFALVYAPSVRDDTLLHLNREGEHWKLRWYRSPTQPAMEIAQSGKASTRAHLNLEDIELVHERPYPHSSSAEGVAVTNSRYWFDEIARMNAELGVGRGESGIG